MSSSQCFTFSARSILVNATILFVVLIVIIAIFQSVTVSVQSGKPDIQSNIIGGVNSSILDYPYQVSVQIYGVHICGGSIVSPKHVLTAAHCLKGAYINDLTIQAGTSVITEGGTSYEVEGYISAPKFNQVTLDCDVGFYILKNPLQFGPTVQAVKLVNRNGRPKHGDMVTITGWGISKPHSHEHTTILQMLKVPALNRYFCGLALNASTRMKFTKNMFCAGGIVGKVAAPGDSGGPGVNKRKELVGIVSWGRGGRVLSSPTAFTDITSPPVRDFIDGVLNGTIKPVIEKYVQPTNKDHFLIL